MILQIEPEALPRLWSFLRKKAGEMSAPAKWKFPTLRRNLGRKHLSHQLRFGNTDIS